jgi:hypothetical protein
MKTLANEATQQRAVEVGACDAKRVSLKAEEEQRASQSS